MTDDLLNKSGKEPAIAREIRRRKAATSTPTKVGMANNVNKATMKRDMMMKMLQRKMQLTIPSQILASNPDKYFVWVNMNKLEKSGMWHQNGYELFKTNESLPTDLKDKFSRSVDNYVHRNEMVLAYLPMEEHKLRLEEMAILKGDRDLTDVIKNDPNLRGFNPKAEVDKNFVSSSGEEEA